jgi:Uma2 family endonuclease
MIDKGILVDDDPVELLEGWLIEKMPKNPRHRYSTQLTTDVLNRLVAAGWHVACQEPITLSKSEPEPDVSVIRGSKDDFRDHHPKAKDVGLAVEVADSTLVRDRTTKKRIYARASIPVYWIVNLIDTQIEVYSLPSGAKNKPDYHGTQVFRVGESVPFILDGQVVAQISVKEFFNPRDPK